MGRVRTDWQAQPERGGAEAERLAASSADDAPWRQWGPYVAARQWGTVREDYSADGDAWSSLTYEQARSRAYRWGEDGILAVCDRWQLMCLGLSLWNGVDDHVKERLFGLTNTEGNHGEDVKEHWWHLDATPTSSYLRGLYRLPQRRYPYEALRAESARRGRDDPEHELLDTGVLDGDRFFDVEVEYAKSAPDDVVLRVRAVNRGPESAPLHLLPTLWFRNTWSWGRDARRPRLVAEAPGLLRAEHATLGTYWLAAEGAPELLLVENESNSARLWGVPGPAAPKDGISDHVVHGASTTSTDGTGTKASAWYSAQVPPGAEVVVRLRLARGRAAAQRLHEVDDLVALRRREADTWHASLLPPGTPPAAAQVARRALAGLLWTVQAYRFDVAEWLEGDPAQPAPPPQRREGRNARWLHLYNADLLSVPDEWEYPWYAAWDLAFHTVPLAFADPDLAKRQLVLLCREWYMHPDGQLPAYEWAFDDVNPPVHAWAAWRVYKIDARNTGRPDRVFLARVFHKLLLNFSWWVNRKDPTGSGLFTGGFLGMDNIGPFDRSGGLPVGGRLEQSDATSWMALYCLNMLSIALELARHDRAYEDVATKFFEHFLAIAHAASAFGSGGVPIWDEEDGFCYDVLHLERDGVQRSERLRVRSLVGLVPLLAVETLDPDVDRVLPDFAARVRWFRKNRPDRCRGVLVDEQDGGRLLLSLLSPPQVQRVLARLLDEEEFLSPFGVRSLSAAHRDPVVLHVDGVRHEVGYEPGESRSGMFGGNSNWRGPVWLPLNFLLVEALQKHHHFHGPDFRVPVPTRGGPERDLAGVADELSARLVRLFLPSPDGSRPSDPRDVRAAPTAAWREHVTFSEYFHGDHGAGLGASHQTGWTALVAKLVRQLGADAPSTAQP